MWLITRVTVLLGLAALLGFAETWPGSLVDSKCFAAEERNVNPTDTLIYVDRDGNREIRYCAPKAKTKLFAIVPPVGPALRLDSTGNAKAAELVRLTGKKSHWAVAVTGEINRDTIQVGSISVAP
jgi:hypothetical protein